MEDFRNPITYTTTPWDTVKAPRMTPRGRLIRSISRDRVVPKVPPPGRQPNPTDVVRLVCTLDFHCV